ncbi:MAG: oxidoreductase [Nitriliruptorales bacterium]
MPWTPEDIPDQRGRIAVVTGANSGLGLATARELARKGAHVVMAVRNQERAKAAHAEIEAAVAGASLEIRELDLASLDSVRACADGIVGDHGRIDLLVNNAGLMGIPASTTEDGFEMQIGVNHLGHFALTRQLLPALLQAPAARVVSVTSFARLMGRTAREADVRLRGRYDPWFAYGRSKLANLQFAVELHRRLDAAGATVASLAAHPGLSHTDLQARSVRETGGGLSQRFWHAAAGAIGMSPAQGALPQLRAATDLDARGGELYAPMWVTFGPPVRRPIVGPSLNREPCRKLWDLSERETNEPFDVTAITAEAH